VNQNIIESFSLSMHQHTTIWHFYSQFSLKSQKFSQARNLHHYPKTLGIKELMSFNPNPRQMNCYRFPSQSANQGTPSLNITIPISHCTMPWKVSLMNPLSFVSLSPPAYDTNYYIIHYLSNAVELQKIIICTKKIHFSCISTYISTISLPTKIQTSNT
jgi:hypothetical protein